MAGQGDSLVVHYSCHPLIFIVLWLYAIPFDEFFLGIVEF